jgi:hypothetical protein
VGKFDLDLVNYALYNKRAYVLSFIKRMLEKVKNEFLPNMSLSPKRGLGLPTSTPKKEKLNERGHRNGSKLF